MIVILSSIDRGLMTFFKNQLLGSGSSGLGKFSIHERI